MGAGLPGHPSALRDGDRKPGDCGTPLGMKKVLLISNKVFHYRVSNYNYFARRFRDYGYEFVVRASELQKNNPYPPEFDLQVVPFGFWRYREQINRLRPDVVILFVH